MSLTAMVWAWEQDCESSTTKLVLLKLADNANSETGYCIPSQERIATQCHLSRRSVATHIKRLEELGLIRVIHRRHQGVNLSNRYVLLMPGVAGKVLDGDTGDEVSPGWVDNEVAIPKNGGVVKDLHSGGAAPAHGHVQELHTNQESPNQEKKNQEQESSLRSDSARARDAAAADRGSLFGEPPQFPPKKRATRLELEELPDDWACWARAEGHQHPAREWDRFRDYWIAAPGQKGVKLDWAATWRNWVRKALESGAGAFRPAGAPQRSAKGAGWEEALNEVFDAINERGLLPREGDQR